MGRREKHNSSSMAMDLHRSTTASGTGGSRNIYLPKGKHYYDQEDRQTVLRTLQTPKEQAWVYNKPACVSTQKAHQNHAGHPVHMAQTPVGRKWAHKFKGCFKTGHADSYGPKGEMPYKNCVSPRSATVAIEIEEAEKPLRRSKARRWDDGCYYSSDDDYE